MTDKDDRYRSLTKLPLTDMDSDPLAIHRKLLKLAKRGTSARKP